MASLKPYSFVWQDGSTNSSYIANQSGNYSLELTYKGCAFKDTAAINVQMPVQLGQDIKACASTSITLSPSGAKDIRWQDGYEKHDRIVNQTGEYIAISSSMQCPSSDTVRIEFVPCPGLVPNVFTPNGDNKNDYFVLDNVTISPWIFEVYNRWGKRVYHHPGYDNSWNGENLPSGQYYYHLSSDRLNQSIKGWVNLLR